MTRHQRTLARLDRMVAEAEGLCVKAFDRADAASVVPDAVVSISFRTVLDRPMRGWITEAEAALKSASTERHPICGQRADELRRLVDTANAAILARSDRGDFWNAFYRLARGSPSA